MNNESPDKNCVSQEDGSCLAVECMHTAPPSVEGDPTIKPVEPPKGYHEKPWGMTNQNYAQFLSLVCVGLERMDKRQRYELYKTIKLISKELNVRWPFGRPMEEIQREIEEQRVRQKLIIPTGINPESLKVKE